MFFTYELPLGSQKFRRFKGFKNTILLSMCKYIKKRRKCKRMTIIHKIPVFCMCAKPFTRQIRNYSYKSMAQNCVKCRQFIIFAKYLLT